MSKCAYYSKGYHPESSCMKKQIDMLTQLLDKNKISLPECAKKREGGSNLDDKERVHALVSNTSWSSTFIIDSRASRNMVSTRENSPLLMILKVQIFFWEINMLLIVWGRLGLILTMVLSMMCCMSQVFLLISCQCITWLIVGLQRRSYSPMMMLKSLRFWMVYSYKKVLWIIVRRYTSFPIS